MKIKYKLLPSLKIHKIFEPERTNTFTRKIRRTCEITLKLKHHLDRFNETIKNLNSSKNILQETWENINNCIIVCIEVSTPSKTPPPSFLPIPPSP